MTRHSRVSPLFRLLIAGAVVGVAAPLSGCIATQIPDSTTIPQTSPPATTEPAPEPEGETDGLPTTLTFAAGADLPDGAYIEWGDGLAYNDAWELTSPDDGNGNWGYTSTDDACTADFYQGLLGGNVDASSGDDSITSDEMIGVLTGNDPVQITELGDTGMFSYQAPGSLNVEVRQLFSDAGEETWGVSARAFAEQGVGLSVTVQCTGLDALDVMGDIAEINPIVITTP